MFATKSGDVRRNELSDFVQINKQRQDRHEAGGRRRHRRRATCTDQDDVLLTTKRGKCIRFPLTDVRVFKGRDSTGVRGIKLADGRRGGQPVAAAIIPTPARAEARAYLKQANAARRAASGEDEAPVEEVAEDAEEGVEEATLTPERYAALGAREQFVLAVSQNGFGKRTSSYEYRVTGRGGSGIVAIGMGKKNSAIDRRLPGRGKRRSDADLRSGPDHPRARSAAFRIQGRAAQGVTVFRVDEGERVVSVERIADVSATGASMSGTAMTQAAASAFIPGTFDPVTLGHLDIIKRAVKLVDHLVIGVATNARRQGAAVLARRSAWR